MRAGLTADASFFDFVLPLLVQGIAMATFFLAMITILLDGVPPQRIPAGVRPVAISPASPSGGFAASIITTLWDRREALHQSRLAEGTSIHDPAMSQALDGLHALGLSDPQALAMLARTMTSQAYLLAADDYFWLSGWLVLAMIGVVWCARRSMSGGGPVAASD